ncbi:hypothetical protein KBY58_05310 [Cyanobium sp. HWJ4-Hawea]|uniref:hypothetical protein n=1 Tax=Cyanobium sp. HWJ4-Hawea TaxID=2823713 RepID=UPI0020CDD213|nr:hypothetical protein [Cyanobium sp. HWJ4-Hawea]MCP9808845.1 hypothetical protein [Cyanobium sp. HWJ4-Hawea]
MENIPHIAASLRDIVLRLDRMQADIARLSQQKVPDRFVPLLEATRHLHCGRDWLVAQIKADVLRSGIDFLDRSSPGSVRKRYLVNPYSSLRWLNGAQPVTVKLKDKVLPAI